MTSLLWSPFRISFKKIATHHPLAFENHHPYDMRRDILILHIVELIELVNVIKHLEWEILYIYFLNSMTLRLEFISLDLYIHMLDDLLLLLQLVLWFLGIDISKLLVVKNFFMKFMFSYTFHVEKKLKLIDRFELDCSPRMVNRWLAIYYILLFSDKLYKMIDTQYKFLFRSSPKSQTFENYGRQHN